MVVVGYGLAFFLLAQALKSLGIGTAYAMWSGLGTVGAAVGGWALFGERLTITVIVGMALVVAGVKRSLKNLSGRMTHG